MSITSHKISSVDGEHYQLLLSSSEPVSVEGANQQAIVICLPAMGVPARKYLPLAESLSRNGFICALFELRGIETSSVRASHQNNFGYHEILNLDLPATVAFIQKRYPANPIYLLGHSIGGQFATLYMSLNPQQIAGLIGVATGTPYTKGWHFPSSFGVWIMAKMLPLIASFIGYFPGRLFGFAGREGKQLVKDWAYSVKTGNYLISGIKQNIEAKIGQLTQPSLFISITQDLFAPPESTQNLVNKLVKSEVTTHHLGPKDFDGVSVGHFLWMKEPAPIVDKITLWLKDHPHTL